MSPRDWVSERVFNLVHRHNLVYNTCWEDPRLDRVALDIGTDDSIMVITSAGCNALDYVLCNPRHVHAVDMNPRQNALLELKMAGIRQLEYDTFFAMFGRGRLPNAQKMYQDKLRGSLSDWSRSFWDRRIKFFDADRRRPFYFRGTSGSFAWMINMYIDRVAHLRAEINDLIDAGSIEEQREIYDAEMQRKFWSRSIRFAMGRDTTLSMLGVPRAQREEVERHYTGGISQFVRDCIDTVLADLPLADNYFWRVYLTSEYTPECCPEYLREENFERLKAGLVDHVGVHTNSVQGFLESAREPISRFVLLDHMDWMSGRYFDLLESEWQAIVDRAAPGARIIWRSGGLRADFVNRARVSVDGQRREVGELLTYHNDLAEELHRQDRVHTYGSFYISDLAA
jgi:S-adenosylmethionine-diacylglycerol 3-amino-3-carboxypropyl transferase